MPQPPQSGVRRQLQVDVGVAKCPLPATDTANHEVQITNNRGYDLTQIEILVEARHNLVEVDGLSASLITYQTPLPGNPPNNKTFDTFSLSVPNSSSAGQTELMRTRFSYNDLVGGPGRIRVPYDLAIS